MGRKPVEPETPRSVKTVEVIQTVSIRGNGVDTVLREVTQYWDKDGTLLAENDPCALNDEVDL
ncbi:carboxypeptidase [Rossellomorea aquimaris]|uniref:carboxypeptidase n=1 Tax=Rossellomorea aquimaris TaxID=189382 RepID=UPI0011E9522C|nr:carboxypeptidase [Rossellomorea aquimaris]TYS91934.1 carboxypeptidase [Rossellomorea aquimaris]